MQIQNLSISRVKYPNQSFDSALDCPVGQQLLVHSASAYNGSTAPNNMAIAHTVAVADVLSEVSGNDFLFQSKKKFGMLAIDQTTAEGGAPTFSFEYWDGASFQPLAVDYTPDFFTTGTKVVLFNPPIDWALAGALPDQYYTIRLVSSIAPSYVFGEVKYGNVVAYREGVESKGELQVRFETRQLLLQTSEEIIGFFAFPSASNTMEASYQVNP